MVISTILEGSIKMIRYAFLIFLVYISVVVPLSGAEEYVLKKGDIVQISAWGEPDLNQTVVIDEQGNISYPLIGTVKAESLILQQLDDKITELLAADYLVNPDITVLIPKQQFFIAGEIKQPGAHPLAGKIGPLQAVTMAGGFTDFASSSIRIIRQIGGREKEIKVNVNSTKDEEGKIKEEYTIRPDDMIIVPRSFF